MEEKRERDKMQTYLSLLCPCLPLTQMFMKKRAQVSDAHMPLRSMARVRSAQQVRRAVAIDSFFILCVCTSNENVSIFI